MIQPLKPIRLNKYSGRNTFSEVTNLGPTEFRQITNLDIYSGMNGDYLRVRRGSSLLVSDAPEPLPSTLANKVVFPTSNGEYVVYATVNDAAPYTQFWSQLLPDGNPVLIGGPIIEITGDAVGFISDILLEGLDPAVTLYVEVEKDLGLYIVRLYSDVGMTDLVASGSIADSTPLPTEISLTESGGSGISGTVQLDVDPVTIETGSIEYNEFSLGELETPPDMKVYNDRVYVFTQEGNKVIYYDATQDRLMGRPMGLEAPEMTSASADVSGDLPAGGTWYYGVEKVNQKDGADLVASSPNRKLTSGEYIKVTTDASGLGSKVFLTGDSLFNDPYWTHIRLWRSKNATTDFTDPLSPLDAQGTPDQLFEVALITRSEMLGTFAPIDTGNSLPPGNAGVSAGLDSINYIITDGNTDDVLVNLIDLNLIGLIPLPGCRTGAVNKGRVWASGIGDDFLAPNGPNIDPTIKEDALYTTELFSQYQEQWDPQAFLPAGRDGKKTTSIQVFMEDVIIVREDSTRRVASGNPDSLVQMLDDKIGVLTFRMTGYIPQIGICAICSDGYFRYLGFDERWHQYIGKTEVSQSIYDLTLPVIESRSVDFVYMNGKLIMLLPEGNSAALGVKEGKGWSLYNYGFQFQVAFNFSNGLRAAVAASAGYLTEIETDSGTDADATDPEADPAPIAWLFETYGMSGEGGLLEVTKYSFWGKLTSVASVTSKSSNQTWQLRSTFLDPGLFASNTDLNEREYLFEPSNASVVPYQWLPLRGQFISFLVQGTNPGMIAWQKVQGRVRPTKGNLGVFPDAGIVPQGPGWANPALMILNFEDPGDTFFDASGKGNNYVWGNVGTKTNRVTQKPGKGVQIAGNGYVVKAEDVVSPFVFVNNLTFNAVFSIGEGGVFTAYGKEGAGAFWLQVTEDGATMYAQQGSDSATYTSAFTFVPGVVYVLTFFMGKDMAGQFYYDNVSASSFSGKRSTVLGSTPTDELVISGALASIFSNLVLGGAYADQPLYGTFEQTFLFWRLYPTEADRDAQTNSVGYFAGPPTGDTFTFTAQNGSGITGTVDVVSFEYPLEPQTLDITSGPPPATTGGRIYVDGIVSFFQIQKTDCFPEQAQRFWGLMKRY